MYKQLLGWVGVACILTAYILNSFGVIASGHVAYALLNMAGSAGIIVSSYAKKDVQPIFLNVVWLIVAAIGLIIHMSERPHLL